jgi:hypothetical protein
MPLDIRLGINAKQSSQHQIIRGRPKRYTLLHILSRVFERVFQLDSFLLLEYEYDTMRSLT